MKKYIIPLSIVAATFAASCSSDENLPQEIDNSMKTPIEFSMTDNTSSMNVGVSGVTRAGFSSNTDMVVKMVAENVEVGNTSATATARKSTITKAMASNEKSVTKDEGTYTYSEVTFDHTKSEQRYWDDAYGRNTQLSIFAVAVKDKTGSTKLPSTTSAWTKDENFSSTNIGWTLNWEVTNTTAQTTTTIDDEDLVYSNNIQSNGQSGKREYDFYSSQYKPVYDLSNGRLEFQLKESGKADGPGKFNTGNLNFTHALSRITLKIKLASEFGENASLDNNEVKVLNMPYKGTLDVVTGQFSYTTYKDAIVMAPLSNYGSDIKGIYMAQVLPGYKIAANADNNMLQFKVVTKDGDDITSQNIYYVTNKSVNTALANNANISGDKDSDGNITMAQGKHYILTITVGKTAINDITATLVDWTTVTGEHTQDNAYLTFTNSFASYTTSTNAEHFDLYRLNDASNTISTDGSHKVYNWGTGWSNENKATLNWDATNNKWTTNWFFEDNKSFYHFRTVGQGESGEGESKTYTTRTIHKDATSGDYFDIEAGKTDGRYYWGAPMVSGKELKYNPTYGYDYSDTDHHLFYAIGATNSNIHITQLHMLSKIRVVLKTVAASQGGVNLQSDENKTTVKITNVFTKGKVNMGNGLVTAGTSSTGNDSRISVDMTTPSPFLKESSNLETNEFTYYIVPQTLVEGQTYVGLEIRTPDNNIYYVVKKLSEIKASSVGNNGTQVQNEAIKWWYPNHSYLYTITLKKTGIENITCTLVDWTEVKGNNQDVTIED